MRGLGRGDGGMVTREKCWLAGVRLHRAEPGDVCRRDPERRDIPGKGASHSTEPWQFLAQEYQSQHLPRALDSGWEEAMCVGQIHLQTPVFSAQAAASSSGMGPQGSQQKRKCEVCSLCFGPGCGRQEALWKRGVVSL